MWSFILLYVFNPSEANLGTKFSFISRGLSVISLVYLWMYLPKTARVFYEIRLRQSDMSHNQMVQC